MKLKSLLLGSAAVMVAVSGARAADAIVIEPEPVEYVRVCDAYGAGWWYIPGTETCIRFDGDIRVEYRSRIYHDDFRGGDHQARYRARLNVRANNETEYGTLSSRIRFVGQQSSPSTDTFSVDGGGSPASVYADWAVISLAGFRAGFADNYWSTAGGYGLYSARNDGFYDYGQSLFLDYTYAANGWTFTLGTEVGYSGGAPTGGASGIAGQPDIYAGVTYSGGGWYLAGVVYYDSNGTDNGVVADGGFAWKLRADYEFANGFQLGGWYMADNGETDYVHGHSWGVTALYGLTDNLRLFSGYSRHDTVDVAAAQADLSGSTWNVGVRWTIVSGLYLQGEFFSYAFDSQAATVGSGAGNNNGVNVRLVRSF